MAELAALVVVEPDPQEMAAEQARLAVSLASVVNALEREAERRVGQRRLTEDRWLADYEQYHGKYTPEVERRLTEAGSSRLFINSTRPKTNAFINRLYDMLFPTDERNWAVGPTPVPELAQRAKEATGRRDKAQRAAAQAGEGTPQQQMMLAEMTAAEEGAAQFRAVLEEAATRAEAMEDQIADQLEESSYASICREVIRDACLYGTGVMKGPTTGEASSRWYKQQPEGGNVLPLGGAGGGHALESRGPSRPGFVRVDPWGFFPDPDARCIEESEGVYERHLMNRKQVRKLASRPGFDPEAVRRLLQEPPKWSTPTYLTDLRSAVGTHVDPSVQRYHVWEYHGPIDQAQCRDMASLYGMGEAFGDLSDPLVDPYVTIWFAQGELLYFGAYPMDRADPIHSVYTFEKDDASIWGFGVPHWMRDTQKAMNAAWRMMMDNGRLGTGPQVVIDTVAVEPVDGDYDLKPHKVWRRKTGSSPNQRPFEIFNIDMHQAELANIIEMCRRIIDEETMLPMIAQGEQGARVAQTATFGGMSLLMNSANVMFRGGVKNWDDQVAVPSIRRIYDWNMQFSDREDIKGDFEVKARGSSVLLLRELQSASLMSMAMNFTAHPVLGPLTKAPPLYRRLVQTHMIDPDEIVKTDDEIEQDKAQAAGQPQQPDPDVLKAETALNIAQLESQTRIQVAEMERETQLMKLAEQRNIDVEKLRAQLADSDADRQSAERRLAVETAVTGRIGPTGGGTF
jgi:hypothetical protein